ncbi:MAG: hypothetical protein HYW78_01460 [Parcubacteria group bacterium]|nr:hypothetical protein [Parcubacteria group bacterium]
MKWLFGGAVIFIALLVLARVTSQNPTSALSTREIALSCTTDASTRFHIHPSLRISINGVEQVIPADIGVSFACMRPLHTHEADGVIHIESAEKRDFTLGDFFAVWDKPFDHSRIFDSIVDATHTLRVFSNDVESQDYEDTVLKDKQQIRVVYETVH